MPNKTQIEAFWRIKWVDRVQGPCHQKKPGHSVPWQVQMGGTHYGNECPPVLSSASYFRGVLGTLLGYRHSFMFQALFQGKRALFPAVGDAYSGVEWKLVHFILCRFLLSVASVIKFQFVNHFTETYACSILSNKVRGLISSAQFIVSMAD